MESGLLSDLQKFDPNEVYIIYQDGLPYLDEFSKLTVAKSKVEAIDKINFLKQRRFIRGHFSYEKYIKS